MKIPFLSLKESNSLVKEDIVNSFKQILDLDWYILGDFVEKFENDFKKFNNVNHCIGVGNGLDALIISLKSLGVGIGDEVILPANTFIATALSVSFVGAKPVLVEPSCKTYNIKAKGIESAISKKTKAIIPVHLYGQACEIIPIIELAKTYKLDVVEDNAQSQGAKYCGQPTGSFGSINATSFYPGKNLGAMGDAGAITTNNEELANKARLFRNYGSTQKYLHEVKGQNSRLDELQAAVLVHKLRYLNKWNEQRVNIADYYDANLKGVGDLILPEVAEGCTHIYHLYVVRTKSRDKLKDYLSSKGIQTLIHYPLPIHLQEAYKELGHKTGDFPVTEELSQTSLSLPVYYGLTEQQLEYITDSIKTFFNNE